MSHITAEIKKWGNSLGVVIPRRKIKELRLTEHDEVDIDIKKKEKIDGFGMCAGKRPFVREDSEHEDLW